MADPDGIFSHYELHASQVVIAKLEKLQRRATRQGRGEEFLEAFRKVGRLLQFEPTTFGEAEYRLPALRMQIRTGVVRPLVIHYGVCEDRPLVFIRGASLLFP